MNQYAERWRGLSEGESKLERAAIEREAAEAEVAGTETCSCGAKAYYRPGVGAFQCPSCGKLQVFSRTDDGYVEQWV